MTKEEIDYNLTKLKEMGLTLEDLDRYHKSQKSGFYERARKAWENVQTEQIMKGMEKYPEPFNPRSWTPKELVRHALQENVDQAHYIYGLYELLLEREEKIKTLEALVQDLKEQGVNAQKLTLNSHMGRVGSKNGLRPSSIMVDEIYDSTKTEALMSAKLYESTKKS